MRFLSLFSGIEAASVAWKPLGWECVAVAELEPFPCAVLKHHYPDVPNLGDVTRITQEQIKSLGHIDVVMYGFPCQDVSVAGLRAGLSNADGTITRSGLFFTAAQIIEWSQARWAIAENVPGLFSSNEGRDFAAVVGELSGCKIDVPSDGWRNSGLVLGERALVEWFVLDAQYCRVESHLRAVPQRRRRVFIVRDIGDWSSREPFFLNTQSLCGNNPPRRSKREDVAGTIGSRSTAGGGLGTDFDLAGGQTAHESKVAAVAHSVVCHQSKGGDPTTDNYVAEVARSLLAKGNDSHRKDAETYVAHALRSEGFDASEDGTGRGTPIIAFAHQQGGKIDLRAQHDLGLTVQKSQGQAIAFSCKDSGGDSQEGIAPTMRSMNHDGSHANGGGQLAVAITNGNATGRNSANVSTRWQVRRITPREAERLQGFQDDYTKINWNGWRDMGEDETPEQCEAEGMEVRQTKKTGKWRVKDADGPRYRALGNSMAVNVMSYIGQRIDQVDKICK